MFTSFLPTLTPHFDDQRRTTLIRRAERYRLTRSRDRLREGRH